MNFRRFIVPLGFSSASPLCFGRLCGRREIVMKKIIMLMLVLLCCVSAVLVSCVSDEEEAPRVDDSWKEQDYGTSTVMGPWNKISIFVPSSKAMEQSEPLRDALQSWTGQEVSFLNGYAYPTNHDIVVGYFADRDISVRAYELLERMERESYFNARYLIYADSGEIAIAYDENEVSNLSALVYAVEYFVENLVTDKEYIAYGRGIIYSGTVDLIAEQELIDIETTAAAWARLEEVATPEIIAALQKYYSLYTDSLIDWLANLYAPGKMNLASGNWAGGFYGAPSGRDTGGFGPDITCTRQVLSLMEGTGALNNLDGGYGQNLPAKMREDIVYMLKTLQDPTDGFFYHPQYDKETMNAAGDLQRRGRDLSAASELFDNLGASPTYDTPTGKKGDGITADEMLAGGTSSVELGGRLTESLGGAEGKISAIVPASDTVLTSSVTDNMFASHDGFAAYLETVKINEESYVWGNTLNAIVTQIKAQSSKLGKCTDPASEWYDMTLVDMLFKFLDERIDPTTGMWEPVTTFRATNGFYKVISVYNACKRSFAKPQLAAEGLIAGLLGDQKSTGNICDVYNIWIGLSDLKSNVKNYSTLPKEERDAVVKYIDDALMRDGAEAILNSYNKYLPYRYEDGSFSDNVGEAAANHNGLPVGLGLPEGDTNATSIAVGVVSRIYSCYGWNNYKVPLYTESDWMRFISIIMELDPVIKYSYLSDDIEQNFDSISDGELETVDNITYMTGNVAKATVKTEGDNSYVEFNKFEINNSGRVIVSGGRALSNPSTVTIEFKMNVLESNNHRISLVVGKYNRDSSLQTIYFGKSSSTSNVTYDSVAGWYDTGIALGEWFNVKIEYFQGNDEIPMYFKVYVNGTLMDIRYTTKAIIKAKDIGAFSLIPLYDWKGTLLYDDVKIIRNNQAPKPDEKPLITPIVIPEYDYATEDGVHTFDKIADGVVPSGCQEPEFSWSDGGVSEAKIVTDGENKYFYFNKTALKNSGNAKFKFAEGAGTSNVVRITARMLVESGNNERISFGLCNSGGDTLQTIYFIVKSGNVMYGVNGDVDTGVKLGEWMDLEFSYYEGADTSNVYIGVSVNGTLIGVFNTAKKDITAEKICTLSFVPLYGYKGAVRLDDIALTRTNETYKIENLPSPEVVAPPVTPEQPDTPVTPDEPESDFAYDTVNGIHTFTPAEPGAIPDGTSTSKIAYTSGGVTSALIVEEGDKCLQLNKTGKDASGSVSFFFDKPEEALAFHLIFELKIGAGSNNGNVGVNLYTASTSDFLYRIFFRANGKQIQFNANGEWVDVVGVGTDTWFLVDAIYYEGNDAGEGAYLDIYVDGIKYARVEALNNYHKAEDITRVLLTPLYAFVGTVYLDTVGITYAKDYIPDGVESPSEPPKPLPSFKPEDGTHTFENAELGEISNGYSDGYITFSDGGVVSCAVVTEGEGKVIKFNKTAKDASGSLGMFFEAPADAASYFMASMKMKVASGATSGEIGLTFNTQSTSAYLFRPLIRANGTQIQIKGTGDWVNVTGVKTGEWFDIDVIYYEGASDTDSTGAYLKIYINGTLYVTAEALTNHHPAENIRRIVLIPLYKFVGIVYIDEVTLNHTSEEPEEPIAPPAPEAPVIPSAGDDADTKFDEMPATDVVSFSTGGVAEATIVPSLADKNGVTKEGVLHYNKTATTANASVSFGISSSQENADKIVFTADYMPGAAGSGGLEFYLDGSLVLEKGGIAPANEWSKLTIIITPDEGGVQFEVYVNGELLISAIKADTSVDAISKMTVRWWKSSAAEMYLDNVSFRKLAPEADAPEA